jgi:hypothetical protein
MKRALLSQLPVSGYYYTRAEAVFIFSTSRFVISIVQ